MSTEYGQVKSNHGLGRRILCPIYGLDQLVTLLACGIAVLLLYLWTGWKTEFVLPAAIGAYIGVIVTMWRATPCSLLLPANREQAIIAVLDSSHLVRRTARGNEWASVRGRLRRWDSDTIRLVTRPNGLLITGRRHDLTILAAPRDAVLR